MRENCTCVRILNLTPHQILSRMKNGRNGVIVESLRHVGFPSRSYLNSVGRWQRLPLQILEWGLTVSNVSNNFVAELRNGMLLSTVDSDRKYITKHGIEARW